MEKGHSDAPGVYRVIVDVASQELTRLSATMQRVVAKAGGPSEADDALARRVLRSVAIAETIRSNCRAANSRLGDIERAEEAIMLARATQLLTRVLDAKWPRPPPSAPN